MNGCATANIAARMCGDLVLNGYSDWYLPSRAELVKLYLNIGQGAPAPNTNVGAFASAAYWSSTEYGLYYAWGVVFSNGLTYNYEYAKYDANSVRAVRAF